MIGCLWPPRPRVTRVTRSGSGSNTSCGAERGAAPDPTSRRRVSSLIYRCRTLRGAVRCLWNLGCACSEPEETRALCALSARGFPRPTAAGRRTTAHTTAGNEGRIGHSHRKRKAHITFDWYRSCKLSNPDRVSGAHKTIRDRPHRTFPSQSKYGGHYRACMISPDALHVTPTSSQS